MVESKRIDELLAYIDRQAQKIRSLEDELDDLKKSKVVKISLKDAVAIEVTDTLRLQVTPGREPAVHVTRAKDDHVVFSLTRNAWAKLVDNADKVNEVLKSDPHFTFNNEPTHEESTTTTTESKSQLGELSLIGKLRALENYPLAKIDDIVESILQEGMVEASSKFGFKLNKNGKKPDLRCQGMKQVFERLQLIGYW